MLSKRPVIALSLSAVLMLSAGLQIASAERLRTVVVIPTRYRIVGLLQDTCRLRSITLVAYQGDASAANPVLHAWRDRQWTRISLDEFKNAPASGAVVLIGDDTMVPSALVDAVKNVPTVRRVESLDTATVTLALAQILKLSEKELLWLARRNELTVKDLNAELRRYGRYGKPQGEKAAPSSEAKTESSSDRAKKPDAPAPAPEEPVLENVPTD